MYNAVNGTSGSGLKGGEVWLVSDDGYLCRVTTRLRPGCPLV